MKWYIVQEHECVYFFMYNDFTVAVDYYVTLSNVNESDKSQNKNIYEVQPNKTCKCISFHLSSCLQFKVYNL
jgi:hypothetical protein